MSERDDINVPVVFTTGLISALLLFVIVVGIQAWFYHELNRENREKVYGQRNEQLEALRDQQEANLTTYRWLDREQGRVAMPIEQAMKIYVRKHDRGEMAHTITQE